MASNPIFFDCFALDLGKKIHNLSTDTIKFALTNTAPNKATMAVLADLAGLATGGGYTSGGLSVAMTWALSGGVAQLTQSADASFGPATGGGFGPFRYVYSYNDTAAAKNLIFYVDNAVSASTPAGQSFLVDLPAIVMDLAFS
jgi:hypothetical protein